MSDQEFKVTIKNPYIASYIFTTEKLSSTSTILALKECVSREFLSKPSVDDQKIIHYGRILKDSQVLEEILVSVASTPSASSASTRKELIFHITLKKESQSNFRAGYALLQENAKKTATSSPSPAVATSSTPSARTRSASGVGVPQTPPFYATHNPFIHRQPPPHVGLPPHIAYSPSVAHPMTSSPMYTSPYNSPYYNFSPYPPPGVSPGIFPPPQIHHQPPLGMVHPMAHPQVPGAGTPVPNLQQQQINPNPVFQQQQQQQQQQAEVAPVAPAPVAARNRPVDPLIRYFNFTLAVKLFVMVLLFSQGEEWTSFKTIFLIAIACLSYMHQVGLLKAICEKCKTRRPQPPPQPPAARRNRQDAARPAEGGGDGDNEEDENGDQKDDDDEGDEVPAVPPPRTGLLVNIEKFVLGLFASLFPEWQHRHVD